MVESSEKAWQVDRSLDKYRRKSNSTERNTHALDHNCHLDHPLAFWLHRPHWRQFDPSPAHNCRRHPNH